MFNIEKRRFSVWKSPNVDSKLRLAKMTPKKNVSVKKEISCNKIVTGVQISKANI